MSRRKFILAATALSLLPATLFAATTPDPQPIQLITLDPGHFHAALVQKFMYSGVSPVVHVYAPAGDDVAEHLKRIEAYNSRAASPTQPPTSWQERVYTGPEYLDKMLADRAGNVVVISGNNARKTEYIERAVGAGLHVLADKPMMIEPADYPRLRSAFDVAKKKGVLLGDIMTERYEITNVLQRELARQPALFGTLEQGTPANPAITLESVHYFSKIVSGTPLKRPQWFFDVRQAGEGLQDVGTHLIDLVQWQAFPEQRLRPESVQVLSARRWPTALSRAQFSQVTGAHNFPDFLRNDIAGDTLNVFANGEVTYRLRNVVAKVTARWDFEAPPGSGDTHYSVMRGTRAILTIRQGAEQNYKPTLYVEKAANAKANEVEAALTACIEKLQTTYPGIGFRREKNAWIITVPAKYDVGHETHFAQVTGNYLAAIRKGRLPDWEVPGLLTKYATLAQAYEMSHAPQTTQSSR